MKIHTVRQPGGPAQATRLCLGGCRKSGRQPPDPDYDTLVVGDSCFSLHRHRAAVVAAVKCSMAGKGFSGTTHAHCACKPSALVVSKVIPQTQGAVVSAVQSSTGLHTTSRGLAQFWRCSATAKWKASLHSLNTCTHYRERYNGDGKQSKSFSLKGQMPARL
jgi:hypothetical protein